MSNTRAQLLVLSSYQLTLISILVLISLLGCTSSSLSHIHKRQIIYHRDSYEDDSSSRDENDASSSDKHYREKLRETSLGSERSYNDIMRELRKDHILREHDQDDQQKTWEDSSNTLQADDDYESHYANSGKKPKEKTTNFWTFLLSGAVVVIITLIAIIISLAVHNRRAMQAQTYRAPNLEAPKVVVEENIYTTTTPKPKPVQDTGPPPPRSPAPGDEPRDPDPPATEALLPTPTSTLVNPNPIRQPMAPFTYSPIPMRLPA